MIVIFYFLYVPQFFRFIFLLCAFVFMFFAFNLLFDRGWRVCFYFYICFCMQNMCSFLFSICCWFIFFFLLLDNVRSLCFAFKGTLKLGINSLLTFGCIIFVFIFIYFFVGIKCFKCR